MDGLRRRVAAASLRWIDRSLQRLVRPRDDQISWVSDPDYIGNAFHLYRHVLTTRPGLRHVWLVRDPAVRTRVEADLAAFAGSIPTGSRVQVVRRHSARGYWRRLRSRWTFHTHGLWPTASAHRRHVVSLWHGMPIKCIGALNTISPNPHPTFGSLHLATSPLFRYVMAAAFEVPVDGVLVAGLPRCDVLVRPHPLAPPCEAIRGALGLPEGDRLVVWLPTYRTPGHRRGAQPGLAGFRTFLDDLDSEQWSWVEQQAAANETTVVIKLHPHDPLNEVDHDPGLDHVRLVRSATWLATGIELYDLLAISDGLLSDVSSVLIDYLATDRPLGIIGFDEAAYTRDVVFPTHPLLASRRIHDLSTPAGVEAFFTRVRHGPAVGAAEDDLSPWLHDVPSGTGCETVLAAVDLCAERSPEAGGR